MYDKHIVLDFEMNPVPKKNKEIRKHLGREIIEIGAVKLGADGEPEDTFSCFVKPEYSPCVTSYITKLTGIKTKDVYQACSLDEALAAFSEWIGSGRTRVYSWSDSDLAQLTAECELKHIEFPSNMRRWMDFQPVFPRLMEIRQQKNLMSLHEAAEWYGVDFNTKSAHRALYDAEITAELVQPVLTGEYISQRDCLKEIIRSDDSEETSGGLCLGEMCGNIFAMFSCGEFSAAASMH